MIIALFVVSGFIILAYAAFLIHNKIEIQIAHAIILIAGVIVLFMPLLKIELTQEGGAIIRIEASETALSSINDVNSRLVSVTAAIDARLLALEKAAQTAPPSSVPSIEDIAKPDPEDTKRIEDAQRALSGARQQIIDELLFRHGR